MAATLLTDTELERDRRLVDAHQAGDVSAFGELYRLHSDRLLRFCQRKVRDGHLAEEIAQETFLKAYRSMSTLDGGKRFYPWLTVIATRLIIDNHRRAGRVTPSAEIELGTVDDAQGDLERAVDREQVLLALGRVRGRHREVLRLRDYEDLSYDAIAQRLGTSPAVVQSLLHRARQALRREYLAVAEHVALVPLLAPVLPALRRLRARAGRAATWLPDPSSLGAPLAAAAVAVTTAIAGWSGAAAGVAPPASPAQVTDVAPRPVGDAVPAPRPAIAPSAPAAADASDTAERPAPPAELWIGPAGAEQARVHGERMPAQLDTGTALIAVDPDVIARDALDAAAALLGGN